MAKKFTIGVFIHPWHAIGRDMIRGIARFAREQPNWEIYLPWPGEVAWATLPHDIKLDGLIVRVGYNLDAPPGLKLENGPKITIGHNVDAPAPDVDWDNRAIGRLGAEHLIEQGHTHLWFIYRDLDYQLLRLEGFRAAAKLRHAIVHELNLSQWPMQELAAKMAKIPSPAGIMAATDFFATKVIMAAQISGRHVPEELAIVGAGDDELICQSTSPELSSVALPGEAAGYAAAEQLNKLLRGQSLTGAQRSIKPTHVAVRRSSDLIAIDDVLIARALRYIRQHAYEGLTVPAVRKQIPLSRRTLELRFRAAVGRTIEQEIRRMQIERAKVLLNSTTLNMTEIAAAAGFSSAQRLSAVFQRELHHPPTAFRMTK